MQTILLVKLNNEDLLRVPDIWLYHSYLLLLQIEATRRFCDIFAEKAGARVFMSDYFRGDPWPMEKFPITD